MKTDVAYEIVDMRSPPMDRIGIIRTVPGGINVYTNRDLPIFLQWDDEDDESFMDDEATGRVSILTPAGRRVEFMQLGLDNWKELEPFWEENVPEFNSDEAVNKYFYERLKVS